MNATEHSGPPIRRRLARFTSVAGGAVLALLSGACNHVFYQPDQLQRLTPADDHRRYVEDWVPTPDGLRLHLWHLPPAAPGPCAGVILHFHGNAENMSTHFMFVSWLVEQGFDVVTFDYRGYGRSGGTPSRAGLLTDGRAAIEWVRTRKDLAGKPLVVLAQSLGGAVAVPVVADLPAGTVAALVLDSTFDSYRAMARDKLAGTWFLWPVQIPLSWLVTDEASPAAAAPALAMPVLSMHATDDPVVPFRRGEALYAALTARDREFWPIDSDQHTIALAAESGEYRQKLVDWICRRTGGPARP